MPPSSFEQSLRVDADVFIQVMDTGHALDGECCWRHVITGRSTCPQRRQDAGMSEGEVEGGLGEGYLATQLL